MPLRWGLLLFACALAFTSLEAQVWKSPRWEQGLREKYLAQLNIVYSEDGGIQNKLDVYVPNDGEERNPTLVWFHGGGWSHNSKDQVSGQLMPFLESGWVVVNVDYRLVPQALAPAAAVDCRCALFWVLEHSKEIKADPTKVVLAGTSAGGHLALLTGMLPRGTSIDQRCSKNAAMNVAAIIDFYGPTHLDDALEGPNRSGSVVRWIGDQPEKREVARLVSPLRHVRSGLPPMFIVHGDADPIVPYEHSATLHKALLEVGVPNDFLTVPGGVHGKFSKEEMLKILRALNAFLTKYGIVTNSGTALTTAEE